MAKTDTFECSVVTPEKIALECEARFVALPAHDGEMGILRNRAPLLVRLDTGTLRIESEDSNKVALYIDGGFAQMVENRLTVLTEDARSADEIDRAAAESALAEAQGTKAAGEAAIEERQRAVKRARAQLRLLDGGR